jgi:hypothetical protein
MIKSADARRVMAAARVRTEEIDQSAKVGMIVKAANFVAFQRMANASLGSIDIAQKKACTFDITTIDLDANSQPRSQFFAIHTSKNGRSHFSPTAVRAGQRRRGGQNRFPQVGWPPIIFGRFRSAANTAGESAYIATYD